MALRHGERHPDYFPPHTNTPEWDAFFLAAFYDIDTERPMGFAVGPIPWSKIHLWGTVHGLVGDVLEGFVRVIRMMDAAFLADFRKEQEKVKKRGGGGGG